MRERISMIAGGMMTTERMRIDAGLESRMSETDRETLWRSVDTILSHGPLAGVGDVQTGLALGYVQSGKTTAITALIAEAADQGYKVIISFLGSTNLLLDQNSGRLESALGIGERDDYAWYSTVNPSGVAKGKEIKDYLGRQRVILISAIKKPARIKAIAALLKDLPSGTPVLIVDDEADQASLNTKVSTSSESSTYTAIRELRESLPSHLYVQFTATPYGPLLLDEEDHLRPDFVEMLTPGTGYTGGREFFVDHADLVVRTIPTLDEQPAKTPPTHLPKSLVAAFGCFVIGAAVLLGEKVATAPVSMLVHSTQRNDVQKRYHFLLVRLRDRWREAAVAAKTLDDLPEELLTEHTRLTSNRPSALSDAQILDQVRYVLGETTPWLVNSESDVKSVDWQVAPVHVLIGGNKLDRGFTVEGLTVTYMNRPPSTQIDTIEQRARAFGYRGDLLPFCQFFATARTIRVLREIVDTEYDLRARLQDCIDAGGTVDDWVDEIGLLLPAGTKPTRQAVLSTLARFNERPAWHQLRRPSLDPADIASNTQLVLRTGLLTAARRNFGRLEHRVLELPLRDVVDRLVAPWRGTETAGSPGWRHEDLLNLLRRQPDQDELVSVVFMELPSGGPRTRRWDPATGFINLLQGADQNRVPGVSSYPGDRGIGGVMEDPSRLVVEVHFVTSSTPGETPPLMTLAIHAGDRTVVRKP